VENQNTCHVIPLSRNALDVNLLSLCLTSRESTSL